MGPWPHRRRSARCAPCYFWLLAALTAFAAAKPGEDGTPEFEKAAALVKQLGHPRFAVREAAGQAAPRDGRVGRGRPTKPAPSPRTRRSAPAVPPCSRRPRPPGGSGGPRRTWPTRREGEARPAALGRVGEADRQAGRRVPQAVRRHGSHQWRVARRGGDRPEGGHDQGVRPSAADLRPGDKPQGAGQSRGGRTGGGPVRGRGFGRHRADRRAPAGPPRPPTSPAQLLANPAWPDALGAADTGPVLRKLLVKWAGTRPASDFVAHQQFALLVQKKPFAEAAPVLAATAKNKDADLLSVRLLAVQALGKVGGKDATDTLTDLIADAEHLRRPGRAPARGLGPGRPGPDEREEVDRLRADQQLRDRVCQRPWARSRSCSRSTGSGTPTTGPGPSKKWKDETAKKADPGKKDK